MTTHHGPEPVNPSIRADAGSMPPRSLELWIAGAIDEVVAAANTGLPTAVVTNPTVVADWTADGRTLEEAAEEVLERTALPLYVQLRGPDADTFKREGDALAARSERLCLKLPSTLAGLEAVRYFAHNGLTTLVTTVCSLEQAYLAAAAGASSICPYMSRLDEAGEPAATLISRVASAYDRHDVATRIYPASVRRREQIGEAIEAGAHGVILFDALFREMCDHPVTKDSLHRFDRDDWSRIPYSFNGHAGGAK